MTRDEVIDLITVMTALDRRTVGEADVQAWLATAGDLEFTDARDAVVAHYRETDAWLMPAHVRRRVREIRADRLARAPISDPPEDLADDPVAYIEAMRDRARQTASAQPGRPAIGGGR